MWAYRQSTGQMFHDGELVGVGYSGYHAGKNKPEFEAVSNQGPIPRGRWTIGERFDSFEHGPVCLRLVPCEGTETHGRSGFLIHGDSIKAPGDASQGCIVLARPIRLQIADSDDRALVVIA